MVLRESPEGVTFAVKVVPRGKRDEIAGVEGDALKVRLNAPPVEGKANEALVRFIAERLKAPRTDVEIVRGQTARHKLIRVRNLDARTVKERLGAL